MSRSPIVQKSRLFLGIALVALASAKSAQAQLGTALSGTGPINRSMGGAATAAPIDSQGALFWNPAAISGLENSEMGFGAEVLIPRTTLTSHVAANTFGLGLPAKGLTGTTGGNNGVFALPSFGLVYKPEDSDVTYGFGLFALGGFGVNYPVARTNPILNPLFPNGFGVAPLYSNYQVLQLAPTIAYQLTDEWAIGFQPNLDLSFLALDPALFSSPTLVQSPIGQGPVYPAGSHTRSRVGGGFQAGVYYTPTDSDWSFGASFKSPQWFETFTYNGANPQGLAARPKVDFDFPFIASIGTAYRGIDRVLIALDLRYVGFRETTGYRNTGFGPTGALQGLGYQDILAVSLGVQYKMTDQWTVRSGYSYNMNPIGNAVTSYNIASPLNLQNMLALGVSYDVTKSLTLSATWVHFFQATNEGPINEPFIGTLRHSDVKMSTTADSIVIGANVRF